MIKKFKKISLPVFTGFISLQISTLFCFGMIAGYLVTKRLSGKLGSIEIPAGRYKIHVHHWILASLGLAVVFLAGTQNFFPSFALGFGGGCLFQGIYCYTDWHRILKKR